jgi:tRNA 2-thiouridine synthesizing protein C
MATKKFMYLNRKAPYGTVYALESLEVVLIAAAFEQDVSLAFIDDGVYQIVEGQNPEGIGMKNFSKTYHALGDYDIKQLFVSAESLEERGLSIDDLLHLHPTYHGEVQQLHKRPTQVHHRHF